MKLLPSVASVVAAALLMAGLAGPALGKGGVSGGSGSGGGATSPSANVDADLAGEVLVKLRSGNALPAVLARYSLTLVSRFGARPIYRLKVIGTVRVKDVVAAMALDPDVLIAEANTSHRSPEARRNIPWAIGQVSDYVVQWAPRAMRLPFAHLVTRGAGVRVAVLDTGVDPTHPLLAGRLLPGKDFVDGDNSPVEGVGPVTGTYGHGTHVAGLIATVAPAASILPLRVLDADGVGNAWVLAEAMLYAMDPDGNPATDDGAHVINLSLGSLARTRIMDTIAMIVGCTPAVPDDAIGDRSDPGYRDDEARCARGNGAVVVAAAGNDGSSSVKEYPAAEGAYGLVSVTATNSLGRLANFSNGGSWVDLAAPGEGITSSVPGGWATWSGTSMAAPLVAGTAALVRSLNLGLSPKDVATRLKRTSPVLCGTRIGLVDAWSAVANVEPLGGTCR